MNFDKFRDNLIKNFRSDSEDSLEIAIREWREQEESDRDPTDQELYLFLENYDGWELDLIWWAGNITGKESMYTQYERQINNEEKKLRHFIFSWEVYDGNRTLYFADHLIDAESFPSVRQIRESVLKESMFWPGLWALSLSFIQEVSREDALNFLKN